MKGFTTIAVVVVVLHMATLGFVFGSLHWQYLLVTVVSGVVIWGVLPALLLRRGWTGLFVGVVVAVAVQQAAFRLWRLQFGSMWFPLAQFAALHFLIAFGFDRLRRPRPSRSSDKTRLATITDPPEQFNP